MNHPKISELLPWYVNGTLELGERQAAALEAASCDECGKDVDDLTKVQAAMLELEAAAPEPDEYAITRALAAVEEEERKKRLGHPVFGWWWALTPWRRALAVSSVLGLVVAAIILVAPKPVAPVVATTDEYAMPVTYEALQKAAPERLGAAAPAPANAIASSRLAAAPATLAIKPPPIASPVQGVQLVRTGTVNLLVANVESAITNVSDAARANGGDVLALNDQTPSEPGVRHTAEIQVSVPESRFDATVAQLAKFGGLQARSVSAENVSSQIVDGQARLRNLRNTEADLLKIMNRAGKVDEILQVENQVSATREQIEELDGQVQALKGRVAMSAITVDLEDQAPSVAVQLSPGAQIRDSWLAAVRSMQSFSVALLGAILWGVAYAPYIFGIALIGGLATTRFRRP